MTQKKDKTIDKEKLLFPPPPDYYKEFSTPNKYDPPNISCLEKLDTFSSFGNQYNLKEINISYNPVEISILKNLNQNYLKKVKLSNNEFFESIQNKVSDINCDNFNIVDELEKEIKFLKDRYKCLLSAITRNVQRAELHNCLIKLSLQKINFYLAALRKKSVIQKTIDYFNKDAENNDKVSEQINNGLINFRDYLKEGLEEFK